MDVTRQTVEPGKVVKCQRESCGVHGGRLIYPGMTYVIVRGRELGPDYKDGMLLCEQCLSELGWELAQTR